MIYINSAEKTNISTLMHDPSQMTFSLCSNAPQYSPLSYWLQNRIDFWFWQFLNDMKMILRAQTLAVVRGFLMDQESQCGLKRNICIHSMITEESLYV